MPVIGSQPTGLLVMNFRRPLLCLALVVSVLLSGCDEFPRDPEGTLDGVRGSVMRVGISEYPPWTTVSEGKVGGIEVELAEGFARELDARIEWIPGTEQKLLEALSTFELDLVIAGLTSETPWTAHVGLTVPYVRTASLVGLPPGVEIGGDLSDEAIAVVPGDPVADRVRDEGGRPVPARDLSAADQPVAAEDWRLAAWSFRPTGFVLERHRHVMAVPPGENGFLVRLERFLGGRGPGVWQALAAAEVRR
jgi:polar amino acid transport system substrate-binding protein